jgi:hypothetical protein
MEQWRGKPVAYGSGFQLMHTSSGKFLTQVLLASVK